jgi:hypothetical protein
MNSVSAFYKLTEFKKKMDHMAEVFMKGCLCEQVYMTHFMMISIVTNKLI